MNQVTMTASVPNSARCHSMARTVVRCVVVPMEIVTMCPESVCPVTPGTRALTVTRSVPREHGASAVIMTVSV